MISKYWGILREAYTGFNEREIDHVFAVMHPTVHWPKAFEGGHVVGYDAIREYWTRQWSEKNPIVDPVSITERRDGKVRHIYVIKDDLIISMDIAI